MPAFDPRLRTRLQAILEPLEHRLPLTYARIWLLDDTGQRLDPIASVGKYRHQQGAHAQLQVKGSLVGRIIEQRGAHVSNDLQADALVPDKTWVRRERIEAFGGFPLISGGRALGALALYARRALSSEDVAMLVILADTAAGRVVDLLRPRSPLAAAAS